MTKLGGQEGILQRAEIFLGSFWYFLLALLPVLSALLRLLGGVDIPYLDSLIFHLLVMLTAMAGSCTEGFHEHLSLDLGLEQKNHPAIKILLSIRDLVGTFLIIQFFLGSLELLFVAFGSEKILGIPVQIFVSFIPLGLGGIYYHWLRRVTKKSPWPAHLIAALLGVVFALPSLLNILYTVFPSVPDFVLGLENTWYSIIPPIIPVFLVLLAVMLVAGLPLYLVLGGIGMLLFLRDGLGAASVMYEGYAVMGNSAIPAIALFTLTGFLLSESNASKRLVEVFLSLFGWFPGGIVIATVLVSSVFTTFTGASGVTILALGGLLYGVLHGSGRYTENFSIGLVTSSGSIGLLFPPSLAMILYGSMAQINIRHVFLAGIIPGILLVLGMSLFGVGISFKSHSKNPEAFDPKRALKAIRESIWELLIPVVIIGLYFSGTATLLETSAIAVLYTLIIETLVKKEITLRKMGEIFHRSMRIIGGVFIILMLAKGLSAYIVDAQIPQNFAMLVQNTVSSKIIFLLLLNVALILTGTLMDIYSAILVVVPLMLPLGDAFGIHPLHLGMIFLVNLELGFMTPPVGLNLFLSSYRFSKPLPQVYQSIVPFLFLQFVIVMVITFIPELSLLLVPK